MTVPSFKLNTGAEIPAIGLGTWQSNSGDVAKAVLHAIKAGYRHIDCAYCYGNEKEVGEGIKESGISREELFITGKIWCTFHTRVEEGLSETLKALGTDYLDLLLVHWPVPLNPNGNHPLFPNAALTTSYVCPGAVIIVDPNRREDGSRDVLPGHDPNTQTWKAMEALLKTGKVKAIGVSNWSVAKLEKLLAHAEVIPAVNQVELHPYLPQTELVEFCRSKGIVVEAFSPLGSTNSPLLSDEVVVTIADKHSAGAGNVLISYQVKRGVVVLPKSVTPSRIESNYKVVELDAEDMDKLGQLHKTKGKRFIRPPWGVPLEFPDW